MNRSRIRVVLAAVCFLAAGVITLYNVGVLAPRAGRPADPMTEGGDPKTGTPKTPTLPKEDI